MRKQFSKKDIKGFLLERPEATKFMHKKSMVIEEDNQITIDGEVAFRKDKESGDWILSLELLREHKEILPKVVVDKGTPPFIAKGADLMRPGILYCELFEKDAVVVIIDEVHGFPLATGRTMFSSEELMQKDTGKVIKIIHNLTAY